MPRKMRDSGVEWIGQVPEGWGIRRFKFVSTALRKGCGITKDQVFDDGDLPCIRYGEIYSKYINAFDRCQSKTRRDFVPEPVYVSKGDILFACTGELVEEIGKNILYNGELPCVAGGDILVASHKQNAAFLNYYLNCHTSQFQKSRGKTKLKVVHARTSDIGNLLVLLPPMPEQERIATYLDARCGEIDAAVAAARQSIEDYKALKKSLIFEVVTGKRKVVGKSRGDDEWSRREGRIPTRPNDDERSCGDYERPCGEGRVPMRPHDDERSRGSATLPVDGETAMRDSGVAWIGAVPEGWRVERLKFLLRQPLQYGASESGVEFCDDLPRYIRITDITLDGKLKEDGKLSLTEDQAEGYLLDDRDILLARSGATVGKAFIYRASYGRAAFAGYLIRAQINDKIALPEFVAYTMQSSGYDDWKNSIAVSATIQNIGADKYNEYKFPLPPLPEQRAIADYLDEKCGAIDALVAEKESLIADLEQYKKSLIFECVTGKREVA